MESLRKNKLFWIFVGVFCFNIFAFGGLYMLVEIAANRVIKKLERYSPSPYNPTALDPDKVSPDVLRRRVSISQDHPPLREMIRYADGSREDWESDRNSNP